MEETELFVWRAGRRWRLDAGEVGGARVRRGKHLARAALLLAAPHRGRLELVSRAVRAHVRAGRHLRYRECSPVARRHKSRSPSVNPNSINKGLLSGVLDQLVSLNETMNTLTRLWIRSPHNSSSQAYCNNKTPLPVEQKNNIYVTAEVHESPKTTEITTGPTITSHSLEEGTPKDIPEGKLPIVIPYEPLKPSISSHNSKPVFNNKITAESPKESTAENQQCIDIPYESLQFISDFSRKNLNFIEYKGRKAVSPNTFDNDDDYCRTLLYKLHPTVTLQKSDLINDLVKQSTKLPLDQFAANLGLVGVEKKKFMSDILEQRRRRKKKYTNYSDNDIESLSSDDSNYTEPYKRTPSDSKASLVIKSKEGTRKRQRTAEKPLPRQVKPRNTAARSSDDSSESLSASSVVVSKKRKRTPEKPLPNQVLSQSITKTMNRKKTSQRNETNVTSAKNCNDIHDGKDTTERMLRSKRKFKIVPTENELSPKSGFFKKLRSDIKNGQKTKDKSGTNTSLSDNTISLSLKKPDLASAVREENATVVAGQTHVKRIADVVLPTKRIFGPSKSDLSRDKSKRTNTSSETSSRKRRSMKTYTLLEDKAILNYVLKDNNQRLVNGNTIWKKLENIYMSLTNQSRSWHSLRNRYLRYILANLSYYSLSDEQEKLLRSAAYTGDIKTKKRDPKENSIFKMQNVVSASNVVRLRTKQAQAPKSSTSAQQAEPVASTSKIVSSTPKNSPKKPSPTYSQLTRNFHKQHRAFSDSEDHIESRTPSMRAGPRKLYKTNH